jgi:hypothetical protein
MGGREWRGEERRGEERRLTQREHGNHGARIGRDALQHGVGIRQGVAADEAARAQQDDPLALGAGNAQLRAEPRHLRGAEAPALGAVGIWIAAVEHEHAPAVGREEGVVRRAGRGSCWGQRRPVASGPEIPHIAESSGKVPQRGSGGAKGVVK